MKRYKTLHFARRLKTCYNTYDEDLDVEFLGGLDPQAEIDAGAARTHTGQPDWECIFAQGLHEKGAEGSKGKKVAAGQGRKAKGPAEAYELAVQKQLLFE